MKVTTKHYKQIGIPYVGIGQSKIPFSQVESAIEEFESEVAYRETNSADIADMNQVFFDARENHNWCRTDEYSIAAREMMIEWLNQFDYQLDLSIATSLFE